MTTFQAILVTPEGASLTQARREDLPEGELLVRVAYSTLNYKDGLALAAKPGVIRKYPMVPGIDFAGVVEESSSPEFRVGDAVVVTGCGTGETRWGGYAQYARIDAQPTVAMPAGMTLRQAMGIGTAGFTAMQALLALERHGLTPSQEHAVLVTGAAGGVGSVAVAILAKLGYNVAASTGRPELGDYLRGLGARTIVDRAELAAAPVDAKPRQLGPERWAAVIDTVGGDVLAGVLRSVAARGSVAVCGLAGGPHLNTTVFPFVLRGVKMLGIDSPKTTKAERVEIWSRLATDLPLGLLDSMLEEISLADVFAAGERILAGHVRGRIVVQVP